MKKIAILCVSLFALYASAQAQGVVSNQTGNLISRVNTAQRVEEYQTLEKEFLRLTQAEPNNWLPYYYAAFCNAKIGFIYQNDGEKIEPFSIKGETQIQKAKSLLTDTQKEELAEVYVVMGMINRTRVFVNPMTYGREYGVRASQCLAEAKKLSPNNPRVLYLEAWEKFYTPKMWGGDKKLAKELAQNALSKLEEKPSGNLPLWGKKESEEILNEK